MIVTSRRVLAVTCLWLGCATAGSAAETVHLQPAKLAGLAARSVPAKVVMRPDSEHGRTRFEQELVAANAQAQTTLASLRARPVAPAVGTIRPIPGTGSPVPPPDCDRRVLKVGLLDGGFKIRPGQYLAIQGCFDGAPPGAARLNGSFPGGFVELQVEQWSANFVHARVPPGISGVADGPARVQLRFGDGSFSSEFAGQFIARRAAYEIERFLAEMARPSITVTMLVSSTTSFR